MDQDKEGRKSFSKPLSWPRRELYQDRPTTFEELLAPFHEGIHQIESWAKDYTNGIL